MEHPIALDHFKFNTKINFFELGISTWFKTQFRFDEDKNVVDPTFELGLSTGFEPQQRMILFVT
jgi:hypothetical protein